MVKRDEIWKPTNLGFARWGRKGARCLHLSSLQVRLLQVWGQGGGSGEGMLLSNLTATNSVHLLV